MEDKSESEQGAPFVCRSNEMTFREANQRQNGLGYRSKQEQTKEAIATVREGELWGRGNQNQGRRNDRGESEETIEVDENTGEKSEEKK